MLLRLYFSCSTMMKRSTKISDYTDLVYVCQLKNMHNTPEPENP